MMSATAVVVARKEVLDHLRDGRAVVASAMMALMGPGVVLLVSLSGRTGGQDGGAVLLGMLSVFALVSSFAGAIDVAMDTTAGERERRSLVPLLLTPATRRDLVLGKWVAVTICALLAVAINSLALLTVLRLSDPVLFASRIQQLLIWVVLGLVPLALFGSAVSVLIAVQCRNTKEAHSALRFLALVPMMVGMFLVFFPTWASQIWFLLPIVGQQALIGFRDPSVPAIRSGILALVTLALAWLALAGAGRVMNRDHILSA